VSGRRPAIGLCAAQERARFGAWDEEANLLPRSYARAIQRAGGIALILPPDPLAAERPGELLDLLDGLVLTGGCDVDPATYGAERHPETGATAPERDEFDLALARAALERDMPLLGICRGMQMLNVAMGGGIEQHLPAVVGHEGHRHTPGAFADHHVRLEPGSLAARVVGREQEGVKSHHHQALDGIGEGVAASGWSIEDGVVEAIELPEQRFALGVLWHPEEDEASRVLHALVDEARAPAGSEAAAR
jgi:putative glutamine amidotransferase